MTHKVNAQLADIVCLRPLTTGRAVHSIQTEYLDWSQLALVHKG